MEKPKTSRRGRILLWCCIVAAAWYCSVAAVVHLEGTTAGPFISTVFLTGTPSTSLNEQAIQEAWSVVQSNYVIRSVPGSVGTNGAIAGIISALGSTYPDHFVTYFPPAAYHTYRTALSGTRSGGVGITLVAECPSANPCPGGTAPTELVITSVVPGGPAAKAGIVPGSTLLAVDGKPLSHFGATAVAALSNIGKAIDGAVGTKVQLTLQVHGTSVTHAVVRAVFSVPSVYGTIIGHTGYCAISEVNTNTASQVRTVLRGFAASHVTGIILDLRNNPGGYVNVAQQIVSMFLPSHDAGKTFVTLRERLASWNAPASAAVTDTRTVPKSSPLVAGLPVAVLVNGNTASAAEMITLGLRDLDSATVVGTTSYGKGTAQEDFVLPNGGDVHLTFARWFGPEGESINGTGITPSHVVRMTAGSTEYAPAAGSDSVSSDPQLREALSLLP